MSSSQTASDTSGVGQGLTATTASFNNTTNDALTVMLSAEDLDGMATALYTVGGPVNQPSGMRPANQPRICSSRAVGSVM